MYTLTNILGRIAGDETPPPTEITFDEKQQEKINALLAEQKRKYQTDLKTLQDQVGKLQGTAKDREALAGKVKELSDQLLTKEELAKQQFEESKVKFEQEVAKTASEAKQWRGLFENTLATQAIVEAASKNKAFSATQLQLLLSNQVKVAQATDEQGNPTNKFNVVMPITSKDGKVIEVPVSEGVAEMRKNPDFANLFLAEGTPGVGLTINNNTQGSMSDAPPNDPAQYRAWRDKRLAK
jgi:hypothetical protein